MELWWQSVAVLSVLLTVLCSLNSSLMRSPQVEPRPFFILADGTAIRRVNVDGSGYATVVENTSDITSLDFDYATGLLYWTDQVEGTIKLSDLNDPNAPPTDFRTKLSQPAGIAVDWLHDRIIWIDQGSKEIVSTSTNRSDETTLITQELYKPHEIVLDPIEDFMYWTDLGAVVQTENILILKGRSIERASLSDGSRRESLISTGLEQPTAIAIDYDKRRLYWADSALDKIESSRLDGTDRRTVVSRSLLLILNLHHQPYGLAVFQGMVYWTEFINKTLHYCQINSDDRREYYKIKANFVQPTSLHLYHPLRQPGVVRCPHGWEPFGYHCYSFWVDHPTNFHSALAECRSKGPSYLVSINTDEEQVFLSEYLKANYFSHTHWWTSGSDSKEHNKWVWEGDGRQVSLKHWVHGKPNGAKYRNYLSLELTTTHQGTKFMWRAVDNDEKYPYICEMRFVDGLKCPSGMILNALSCYEFNFTQLSWEHAETHCQRQGGHLVAINSKHENDFLAVSYKNKTNPWIGSRECSVLPKWKVMKNRKLSGHDVPGSWKTSSLSMCKQLCLTHSDCKAVIWNRNRKWFSILYDCELKGLAPNESHPDVKTSKSRDLYVIQGSGGRWLDGSSMSYSRWKSLAPAQSRCCGQFDVHPGVGQHTWTTSACEENHNFICEYDARKLCIGNGGRGPCQHECHKDRCMCPAGYLLLPDGTHCQDVDECAVWNGGCTHTCTNLPSTYLCSCLPGYSLGADNKTCLVSDGCSLDNGDCKHICHATSGKAVCSCKAGYSLLWDARSCRDVNECNLSKNPCPDICHNTHGSYRCSCKTGYTYRSSSTACVDVNECALPSNGCLHTCVNTHGSYRCSCFTGFALSRDNVTCEDIDECKQSECDHRCVNLPGSYHCSCAVGYILGTDRKSCVPVSCGLPPRFKGITVTCSTNNTTHKHSYGEVCHLTCIQGEIQGPNIVRCGENGNWTHYPVNCLFQPPSTTTPSKTPSSSSASVAIQFLVPEITLSFLDHTDPHTLAAKRTTKYAYVSLKEATNSSKVKHTVGAFFKMIAPDVGDLQRPLCNISDDTWSLQNSVSPWMQLVLNKSLNYEETSFYSSTLRCRQTLSDKEFVQGKIWLFVENMPEAPYNITLVPSTVLENSPAHTFVGRILIKDEDRSPGNYSIEVLEGTTQFYVNKTVMYLRRGNINYEAASEMFVKIKVVEVDTGLSLVKNLPITVVNSNDPPCCVTINGTTTLDVSQSLAIGAEVGYLEVADEDEMDKKHAFEIIDTNDTPNWLYKHPVNGREYFKIHDQRVISTKRVDTYNGDILYLNIKVTDSRGASNTSIIYFLISKYGCGGQGCDVNAQCYRSMPGLPPICRCRLGFEGDGSLCVDINDCSSNPCDQDHSDTCVDGTGGLRNYTCFCKPGWKGKNCQLPVDSCLHKHCQIPGSLGCSTIISSSHCVCAEGYSGERCEVDTDDCASQPCLNGGQCSDMVNGYTCQCAPGFGGVDCGIDLHVCERVVCPHNGVCAPTPESVSAAYSCRCLDPFTRDCRHAGTLAPASPSRIEAVNQNPTHRGCVFGHIGPECTPCNSTSLGPSCFLPSLDMCRPNPCSNGATCAPTYTGFGCICKDGWYGTLCERPLQDSRKPVSPGAGEQDMNVDIFHHGSWTPWIAAALGAIVVLVGVVCLLLWRRRRSRTPASHMQSHPVSFNVTSSTVGLAQWSHDPDYQDIGQFANPAYDMVTARRRPSTQPTGGAVAPPLPCRPQTGLPPLKDPGDVKEPLSCEQFARLAPPPYSISVGSKDTEETEDSKMDDGNEIDLEMFQEGNADDSDPYNRVCDATTGNTVGADSHVTDDVTSMPVAALNFKGSRAWHRHSITEPQGTNTNMN